MHEFCWKSGMAECLSLSIIDGPNDGRHNIINHMNVFNMNVPIIWDDAQVYEKYAIGGLKVF